MECFFKSDNFFVALQETPLRSTIDKHKTGIGIGNLKAQNFSSELKLRVGYHQILAKFVNFFRAISPKIFTFCNYHSPHHISLAKMS